MFNLMYSYMGGKFLLYPFKSFDTVEAANMFLAVLKERCPMKFVLPVGCAYRGRELYTYKVETVSTMS